MPTCDALSDMPPHVRTCARPDAHTGTRATHGRDTRLNRATRCMYAQVPALRACVHTHRGTNRTCQHMSHHTLQQTVNLKRTYLRNPSQLCSKFCIVVPCTYTRCPICPVLPRYVTRRSCDLRIP